MSMADLTDNDGNSEPRQDRFELPIAGQVGGHIAQGHEDKHSLPYDGQVSGRRRQPGLMSMEHCTGSTDEEGMIAELELMVEKKTTELTRMEDQLGKRNFDVETLEKKLKSYEEIERNPVHHTTEHDDASIKAQLQLIKYQEKENEDLHNQLKERDQQLRVYQEKLKNSTDLMELQTRRMEKQENEYRKLEKDLQETKERYTEVKNRLHEETKENNTTIAYLNQKISTQSDSLQKQETHIERTTTEIIDLKNTLQDTEQTLQQIQRSVTKDPIVEMQKREKMLVVAIDIGRSHSGYAFSFKYDYNADPTKVSMNQSLVAGSGSLKPPTCALFDENKRFHSFGYEAEDTYNELVLDDEHEKWYFFKHFERRFCKVQGQLYIEDDKGRKLPAKLVYGEVIKYLKEHCLHAFQKRGTQIGIDDIHWVLPVPALWKESERLREAAYQADIYEEQLSIVPQSETVAMFVQYLPTDRMPGSEVSKLQIGKPGSRFMVIDLGTTADITVYKRQSDDGLNELHTLTGGPLGDTKIDEEFHTLLIKIVGAPVFKKFYDQNRCDALDLQREFETKKRITTSASSNKITLKVPVSLAETYKEEMGETVKEAIEKSPFDKKIQWIGDKLRMNAEIFKALFKTCCENIVKLVNDVLQTPSVKGTNIFLMVGGFSESAMVQDAMKKAFPNVHIIIPDEAGLSVLKCAVIYGHHPLSTTE